MYTPTQRLMRSRTEKVIAGVGGGIAHYLAIDPVIVRLAFIAFCFTGVGVLLYPILWLVMPLEPETGATVASRVGGENREVFVAYGSTPRRARFDPMTGEPTGPEEEIPIDNINPPPSGVDPRARRNQLLGYALLIVGGLILLSSIAGLSGLIAKLLFPALLIGVGVYVLRRNA